MHWEVIKLSFWGAIGLLGLHLPLQCFVHVRNQFQPSILTKFIFEHFDHGSFVYCIWMYMICIANKQTISTVHATDTRVLISSSVQKRLQSAMGAFCLSPFCAWTLLRAIFIRLSSNAGIMPVTSQRPRRLALVRRGSLFSFTFYQHPGWSPKSYSHSAVWTQNEKFMLGKVSGALQNPTLRAEPLGGGVNGAWEYHSFVHPDSGASGAREKISPSAKSEATLPWDMAKRLEISQNENHLVPATQQQPVPSHSQKVKSI